MNLEFHIVVDTLFYVVAAVAVVIISISSSLNSKI